MHRLSFSRFFAAALLGVCLLFASGCVRLGGWFGIGSGQPFGGGVSVSVGGGEGGGGGGGH